MKYSDLIACHDCDLLQHHHAVPEGSVAECVRCGAVLYRNVVNGVNRMIAYSISALVLLMLANVFPFLAFEASGQVMSTSLLTGVHRLWLQGMWPLALLVLFTTVVFPLTQLLFVLYIFVPLKFARLAPRAAFIGHRPLVKTMHFSARL